VQHISGVGEKWEMVDDDYNTSTRNKDWSVMAHEIGDRHYLPRSEYRLCDPPERWVNVTGDCRLMDGNRFQCCIVHNDIPIATGIGYRLRKVEVNFIDGGNPLGWAFIVEKKRSE